MKLFRKQFYLKHPEFGMFYSPTQYLAALPLIVFIDHHNLYFQLDSKLAVNFWYQ